MKSGQSACDHRDLATTTANIACIGDGAWVATSNTTTKIAATEIATRNLLLPGTKSLHHVCM